MTMMTTREVNRDIVVFFLLINNVCAPVHSTIHLYTASSSSSSSSFLKIFLAHQHKARRQKILLWKQSDHSDVYSEVKVLQKETAFPRCRASDSCWNKKPVSVGSSVTARPNSCISSPARWFHVPAVSIATGTKTMAVGQLPVFGFLGARRFVSCRPSHGRRVCEMWIGIGIWNCNIPRQWLSLCLWEQHDTTWAFVILLLLLTYTATENDSRQNRERQNSVSHPPVTVDCLLKCKLKVVNRRTVDIRQCQVSWQFFFQLIN